MKRLLKILPIIALISVITLSVYSCSAGDYAGGSSGSSVGSVTADKGSDGADGGYTGGDMNTTVGTGNVGENRKIIKNVNESVQTDKYDDFLTSLTEAVGTAGGYISTKTENGENFFDSTSLRYSYLVIRIPADKLDSFTSRVDSLAVVTSYNESAVDVTGEYIDVESRIGVLEAEETALLDMLTKATSVETALDIRTRLLTVQSDLASLRAQKEDYDDRIAYSTVYLRINEVRRATENNPGFFEEVGGNFSDSLYNIGQGFRSFGVWLLGDFLYILLFLAVATGAFFLLRFIYKKYRKSSPKVGKDKDTAPENSGEGDGSELK